jgi:nucleoid-associated protein YgaU
MNQTRLSRKVGPMGTIRAIIASVVGVLFIAVPPYLLVRFIGNPYPREGIDLTAPLTDNAVLGVLAVIVWVLWAQFTVSLVVELYAAAMDRAVDVPLPVFAFQADFARVLVGAIVAATVAAQVGTAMLAGSAAAVNVSDVGTGHAENGPSTSPSDRGSRSHSGSGETVLRDAADRTTARGATGQTYGASRGPTADGRGAQGVGARVVTVTVSRGDSLWSLAETYLGDGSRWDEIAAANDDRTMVDGTTFRSADQIRPGWQLRIPGLADATESDSSRSSEQTIDTYQVQPGDTLSEIAQDVLGDPQAYPTIFAVNQGVPQPGGDALTDADHIEPGWTLTVPEARGTGTTIPDATGERDERASSRSSGAQRSAGDTSPRTEALENSGRGAAEEPHRNSTTTDEDSDAKERNEESRRRLEVVPDIANSGSADGDAGASGQDSEAPVTVLRALLASALCLAAGAFGVVLANRRRQMRNRLVGRTIAPTPDALAEVEQTVTETGAQAQAEVEYLDRALRYIAASCALTGDAVPPLGAAVLGDTELTLMFSSPVAAEPPVGWTATDDHRAWTLSRSTFLEPDLETQPAPYPALVSIGLDAAGRTWLLDLEAQRGRIGIAGDPRQVEDVVRFMTAELAVNAWSDGAEVLLTDGICPEVVGINPLRLRHVDRTAALTRASVLANSTGDAEDRMGADTLTRRRDRTLLDGTHPMVVVTGAHLDEHALATVRHMGERSRVVLVHADGMKPAIVLSSDGTAVLTRWGITVQPFTLKASEADAMAALVHATRDLRDAPVPPTASDDGPLGRYARADGSLREEFTRPRHTRGEDATSMLPASDEVYVSTAATSSDDLAAVAPSVPEHVRTELAALDPTLDQDVADWFDDASPRPKVHLLGPVTVSALNGGDPASIDNAAGTVSFIAYLSVQDHGVTGERAASACGWKTQRTVQNRATNARFLLGTQPDGTDWLPDATASSGARRGSTPTYELIRGDGGILNSADLFIRLKHRAQRRGDDGCDHDLVTALTLVTGAPFEAASEQRFRWLFGPGQQRHDELLVGAIHDAAHVLATRGTASGRTDVVTFACNVARLASPHSDIASLDEAAATEAEDGQAAAVDLVRRRVLDRSDDDLPPRTDTIVERRKWASG